MVSQEFLPGIRYDECDFRFKNRSEREEEDLLDAFPFIGTPHSGFEVGA